MVRQNRLSRGDGTGPAPTLILIGFERFFMPIERRAILGTWSLIRTYQTIDGKETGPEPLGQGAKGFIHYMTDDRMAVLMANAGRSRLTKGRYNSGEAETAESARSFTAYAGTFEVDGDIIVHHLDICLYENDNGVDYIRHANLDGDKLTLRMPPVKTKRGEVQWSLEWQRQSSFS